MFEYRARILRVIDGDTVEAEIDLGFQVSLRATLRLAGIDTPELRGPTRDAGRAATDYLELLLSKLAGPDHLVDRDQDYLSRQDGGQAGVLESHAGRVVRCRVGLAVVLGRIVVSSDL